MSNTDTNEPAFPTQVWDSQGIPQHTQGMTLRDYFAAKAMLGVAHEALKIDEIAVWAYKMADEMLKAREA
jgi:hypothetical protein